MMRRRLHPFFYSVRHSLRSIFDIFSYSRCCFGSYSFRWLVSNTSLLVFLRCTLTGKFGTNKCLKVSGASFASHQGTTAEEPTKQTCVMPKSTPERTFEKIRTGGKDCIYLPTIEKGYRGVSTTDDPTLTLEKCKDRVRRRPGLPGNWMDFLAWTDNRKSRAIWERERELYAATWPRR